MAKAWNRHTRAARQAESGWVWGYTRFSCTISKLSAPYHLTAYHELATIVP